jgi:hypothetical protein
VRELETGPLHRFRDWPNDQVPKRAAGVYTVWDSDRLVYVGMSGRAMTADDLAVSAGGWGWPRAYGRGSTPTPLAAAPGTRSVYVCDRFVVPALIPSQQQQLAAGGLSLDDLTRSFIRDRLAYRFVVAADGAEAAPVEAEVRRGALSVGRPYLNPLEPPWN